MFIHERIPREIFETILHLCVGDETPARDLAILQLVCRAWHDIVAEASFLWATITTEEGSQAFYRAFRMAKDALLDIIFIDEEEIEASEFFSVTGEKIEQWRSLRVESNSMRDASAIIQTQKPLKLRTLHVAAGYVDPSGEEEIVLFGGAPATGLKDIVLTRVPINPVSLELSGLKSLHLEGIPSITAAEVITLLNDSPTLEILHLTELKGAVLSTQPATTRSDFSFDSPIQLAFLTELHLIYLPLPFQRFLLSTLAVPQLHFLKVYFREPAAQLLATTMHRLKPTLISLTSGAQEYQVTLSSHDHYVIAIGGLSIHQPFGIFSESLFVETFTWLSENLEVALADLPLHLIIERHASFKSSDLEWFTRRTNVTGLRLSYVFFGLPTRGSGFIPLLGRPTPSPPSSSEIWLLPQLEVFESNLAWTDSHIEIVDMIKARHSVGTQSSPKHFRQIRLNNYRNSYPIPLPIENFMSEVVQAAEGVDVYWQGRKWPER